MHLTPSAPTGYRHTYISHRALAGGSPTPIRHQPPRQSVMRLAYGPWGETIAEMVEAGVAAEAAGFDSVWTAEIHRSAFVPAAAMAQATERVGVGLGLGVRRLNEDWHGTAFGRPVPHLRETVTTVRHLIREVHLDRPIEVAGQYHPLRLRGYQRPFPPVRECLPIYLAGLGPHMVRLAGEIGDGWIAHELGSPGYTRVHLLPNLREGLSSAGHDPESFTRVVSACCVPHRDGRQARRWAAGLVAFYASVRTYHELFALHGFGERAAIVRERFRAGDVQGMIDACSDEMVDAFTIAGHPDEVRARLQAYQGVADVVKVTPPTHNVSPEVTRHVQRAILELLGDPVAGVGRRMP